MTDRLTPKELEIYDWVINHKYTSISPTYSRILAECIKRLLHEIEMLDEEIANLKEGQNG